MDDLIDIIEEMAWAGEAFVEEPGFQPENIDILEAILEDDSWLFE